MPNLELGSAKRLCWCAGGKRECKGGPGASGGEDLQEEVDFASQSRTTDVKIIGFLRNIEKGKFLECGVTG